MYLYCNTKLCIEHYVHEKFIIAITRMMCDKLKIIETCFICKLLHKYVLHYVEVKIIKL